jgi:hypothetical protein
MICQRISKVSLQQTVAYETTYHSPITAFRPKGSQVRNSRRGERIRKNNNANTILPAETVNQRAKKTNDDVDSLQVDTEPQREHVEVVVKRTRYVFLVGHDTRDAAGFNSPDIRHLNAPIAQLSIRSRARVVILVVEGAVSAIAVGGVVGGGMDFDRVHFHSLLDIMLCSSLHSDYMQDQEIMKKEEVLKRGMGMTAAVPSAAGSSGERGELTYSFCRQSCEFGERICKAPILTYPRPLHFTTAFMARRVRLHASGFLSQATTTSLRLFSALPSHAASPRPW